MDWLLPIVLFANLIYLIIIYSQIKSMNNLNNTFYGNTMDCISRLSQGQTEVIEEMHVVSAQLKAEISNLDAQVLKIIEKQESKFVTDHAPEFPSGGRRALSRQHKKAVSDKMKVYWANKKAREQSASTPEESVILSSPSVLDV